MDFRPRANFGDEKIDLLSKHGLDISKLVKQIIYKRDVRAQIGHQNQNLEKHLEGVMNIFFSLLNWEEFYHLIFVKT